MEIFNIGPLELLVILVLAVLMFGPEDIVNFAHKAGHWIYDLRKSELWQELMGTTKQIQEFPQKIMKEAELEETMKEINALNKSMLNSEPPQKAESSSTSNKYDKQIPTHESEESKIDQNI